LSVAPAPAVSGGKGRFDYTRLEQQIQEIGVGAVVEMAADFLNELPDRLTEIRRLSAAGQWPELKRAAHSIKGLFFLFGLTPLADLFQSIEEAAIISNAGQVAALLLQYDPQAESATGQLREWMDAQKAHIGE
jgi:HPt (histidine-containing phosphotransfer) domain-containing protein